MSFCSFEDENENDILKNFPLNSIFEKIHFRFISSYLLYNLFTSFLVFFLKLYENKKIYINQRPIYEFILFFFLSIKINQVKDSTTPYLSNCINDLKLNFKPIFDLKNLREM